VTILLWTTPILMGLALVAWTVSSFPARRVFLPASLILALLIGGALGYMSIWQAVPAAVISLIWLIVLQLVNKFGSADVNRPYSGALFGLLLVIAIAPIYSAPVHDLPEVDGPYKVGMKGFVVTDTTRLGIRGVAADAPRKILVRAYYPADNVDELTLRPYMTPGEYKVLAEAVAAMGQPGFMDSYKQLISTNTYENAPVSTDGNFPMVLYSHGFTGPMAENLFIVENMASRGHVVFMASHPGNTRAILYPDGTSKKIDASITNAMADAFVQMMTGDAPVYDSLDDYWEADGPIQASQSPMFAASINIWRDDMIAIADALFSGNVDADIAPIWDAVDNSKFAYVGMSFGGSTAGISCQADPRCTIAISLDGNNFDPALVNSQIRMPILSIQAPMGEFPGTAGLKDIGLIGGNDMSFEPMQQAGLSGLVTRVEVRDTKHLSYTDNASFWRGPIRPVFMVGTLPAAETNAAVNGLIGAYLDEHFKGQSGATAAFIASNDDVSTYSLDYLIEWAKGRGL
jgi:hypothetical protein